MDADCPFTVLSCWYSQHYPLTCLQTAHFIILLLKFSFVWQHSDHRVILSPFPQLLFTVLIIWYVWNVSLKNCASSALLLLLLQESSAGKTNICTLHWCVLTPSWLHRRRPNSSRCCSAQPTIRKSTDCKSHGGYPLTQRCVKESRHRGLPPLRQMFMGLLEKRSCESVSWVELSFSFYVCQMNQELLVKEEGVTLMCDSLRVMQFLTKLPSSSRT